MKRIASVLAIAALGLTPALAQTPGPAAAPTTAAPAGGGGPLQAIRAQCRDQAKDLTRPAHRQAMEDCLIKARPDKAVQIRCQMDAMAKGKTIDKDARKAMVKECVTKARG